VSAFFVRVRYFRVVSEFNHLLQRVCRRRGFDVLAMQPEVQNRISHAVPVHGVLPVSLDAARVLARECGKAES